MNPISVGSLGSILPEILLMVGGLLILLFDTFIGDEEDSGASYMAISILFLLAALIGVIFQIGIQERVALVLVSIDPFATFAKLTILVGMTLVAVAGGSYMNRRIAGRGEFWTLYLFVTLAMSLAVSANNLILIFLAIEFLSITSYLLVGFVRDDLRSSEAGIKYFLFGSIASSIMLYGMSLIYGAASSLSLSEIGQAFASNAALHPIVMPATVLTLVGLGFKTSLAPFHQWAPDTYDGAPTPITAYLSTVSKATGFAVMARVLLVGLGTYRVDWIPVLAGLSIVTMSIGNLVALRQTSVKRMLAYSSIAQAGYILMGLVAIVSSQQVADLKSLSMNGLNGVLIYLFAYLFTNVGAFLVVMAIEEAEGNSEVSSFNNLAQRSPALAWSMFIFMLSLTGIPLTGGFMGKFFVFGAAIQHQFYWLAFLALVNAGVAAYYYLNVVRSMFFGEQAEAKTIAIPLPIQIVVVICLVATLWIGLYPPKVIEWANDASQQLLTLVQ
ncbi:MAG: NADH-quinone oxidoreductase subunit N [Caldilineaceae bacterium]